MRTALTFGLIAILLAAMVLIVAVLPPQPQPRFYLVFRLNPNLDGLLRPGRMGSINPTIIKTPVVAERYREGEHPSCYVFLFRDRKDTICDVVGILDKGPL